MFKFDEKLKTFKIFPRFFTDSIRTKINISLESSPFFAQNSLLFFPLQIFKQQIPMNSAEISNESLQLSIDFSPRLRAIRLIELTHREVIVPRRSVFLMQVSQKRKRERETTYVIRARV